jgi:hypothetical protein
MPDKICFIEKTSLDRLALNGGLIIGVATIMPHARERSKRRCNVSAQSAITISAKRNGEVRRILPRRHCERSEAIQSLTAAAVWIASLCSQ